MFGPLVGAAVWLYLSDFFQTTLHLGATWKLVLGVVFVLLVCFLRRGIVGGDRRSGGAGGGAGASCAEPDPDAVASVPQERTPSRRARPRRGGDRAEVILRGARG